MKTYEVAPIARELMNQHGLVQWTFQFDRAKRRAGLCQHRRQTISISVNYVHRNTIEDIKDTILHEIAHALVGPGHGHNRTWKLMCVKIGAKPQRCCGEHVDMPKGHWQALCKGCKKVFHKHRRPKYMTGTYCRKCGPVMGDLVWGHGTPKELQTKP